MALGLSDRLVTPRNVKLDLGDDPIVDSLVFLMLGQDAADGRMRLSPTVPPASTSNGATRAAGDCSTR